MAQHGWSADEWAGEADGAIHHNYPEPELDDVRATLAYLHLFDEEGFDVRAEWMAR